MEVMDSFKETFKNGSFIATAIRGLDGMYQGEKTERYVFYVPIRIQKLLQIKKGDLMYITVEHTGMHANTKRACNPNNFLMKRNERNNQEINK